MNIRLFKPDLDYSKYLKMYESWELPAVPQSWLPDETFIVEEDSQTLCMGSLFQLGNSAMYWIEGIVTDRSVDTNKRKQALEILINHLSTLAKHKGGQFIMASTPRESLKNMFKDSGFKETPEKYYHVGRII